MGMLEAIFITGIVIASMFLLWTYTKPGKKWLKSL